MVFNTLGEDAEMEWVMIDSTIVRAHQHAADAKRGSKTKHEEGLVAAFLPRSMRPRHPYLLMGVKALDCTQALALLDGMAAKAILAHTGYDADDVMKAPEFMGAEGVIASKSNRKNPQHFDKALYRERNFIERVFNQLKNFRRGATRYDTTASACLAFVIVADICLWRK
jgi:transposase